MEEFPDSDLFANLGHSRLDLNRNARCGIPEAVFAPGKSVEELIAIAQVFIERSSSVLITKMQAEQIEGVLAELPQLEVDKRSGTAFYGAAWKGEQPLGKLVVVTAGTADSAAASEAEITARYFGFEVERLNDVGIAGLPRLFQVLPMLERQDVIIAVAGMEGALPTVINALTTVPVIALPTSSGLGVGYNGFTALFGMLSSCSPGLAVVNIDNGFGAAATAAKMVHHLKYLHNCKREEK